MTIKAHVTYKCSCNRNESLPLHQLYFCPHCCELRCSYCLQDEINFYYCPNCLLEVPSALVKSGKNRCNRNCYKCCICTGSMVLINKTEDHVSSSHPISETENSSYTLLCPNCGWMPDLNFDKPSAISSFYLKKENDSKVLREFDRLYDYYRQLSKTKKFPEDIYQSQELSWFNKKQFTNAEDPTFQEEEELIPSRVHLRTKRSRRCKACQHNVIKPETKIRIVHILSYKEFGWELLVNITNPSDTHCMKLDLMSVEANVSDFQISYPTETIHLAEVSQSDSTKQEANRECTIDSFKETSSTNLTLILASTNQQRIASWVLTLDFTMTTTSSSDSISALASSDGSDLASKDLKIERLNFKTLVTSSCNS